MSFPHWQRTPESIFALGPVVPVIVIDNLADALPMAEALLAADIRALEVTLRTPFALEAIRLLSEALPQAVVGAGTVTNPDELAAVIAAGAQFAISPGITEDLLHAGAQGNIPLIPGVATISELMLARSYGYQALKFFPAEAAGGTAMLKSISGPFPDIQFCPTGGIHQDNFLSYLQLPNVRCVGGSWILPKEAIQQKDWVRVTSVCHQALMAARTLG